MMDLSGLKAGHLEDQLKAQALTKGAHQSAQAHRPAHKEAQKGDSGFDGDTAITRLEMGFPCRGHHQTVPGTGAELGTDIKISAETHHHHTGHQHQKTGIPGVHGGQHIGPDDKIGKGADEQHIADTAQSDPLPQQKIDAQNKHSHQKKLQPSHENLFVQPLQYLTVGQKTSLIEI